MKKLIYHIIRLALAILPAMLTVAPAMAQNTVYQGQVVEFSIETLPEGSTYHWDVYCDLTVNFAQTPGNCAGTDYQFTGSSNEATTHIIFNRAGEYIVKIEAWDPVACTNNMKFYLVEVEESLPTAALELDPDEICVNEPSVLQVTLTGAPVWKITLRAEDEDGHSLLEYTIDEDDPNPYDIVVSPVKTTWYTVIRVEDANGEQLEPSNTVTLTVHPLPANSRIYLRE